MHFAKVRIGRTYSPCGIGIQLDIRIELPRLGIVGFGCENRGPGERGRHSADLYALLFALRMRGRLPYTNPVKKHGPRAAEVMTKRAVLPMNDLRRTSYRDRARGLLVSASPRCTRRNVASSRIKTGSSITRLNCITFGVRPHIVDERLDPEVRVPTFTILSALPYIAERFRVLSSPKLGQSKARRRNKLPLGKAS